MREAAGVDYPSSYAEVRSWFDEDWKCLDYLDWLRWPEGFQCPHCDGVLGWRLKDARWKCAGCDRKVSATAGAIFDKTRTPLTVWCDRAGTCRARRVLHRHTVSAQGAPSRLRGGPGRGHPTARATRPQPARRRGLRLLRRRGRRGENLDPTEGRDQLTVATAGKASPGAAVSTSAPASAPTVTRCPSRRRIRASARRQNASTPAWAVTGVASSPRVRHQRCAREWLPFSTVPLRLPCREGQMSTPTP